MHRIRSFTQVSRVSPSLVIAIIALFVAAGGPAHAAKLLTGAGILNGSVTGVDIRNGSISATELTRGARNSFVETPAEVLRNVRSADGAGSGLDADLIDGLDGASLQHRVTKECAAGASIRAIGADGTVTCETDDNFFDASPFQRRVADTCAVNSSIRAIGADGTVSCDADDTFTFDSSLHQVRVSQSCATNSSIRGIDADGSVQCEADDTFVFNPTAHQVRVSQACPVGQSIRAIATSGEVTCEQDDNATAPAGPAGGALAGTYPNPGLAANSVTSEHLEHTPAASLGGPRVAPNCDSRSVPLATETPLMWNFWFHMTSGTRGGTVPCGQTDFARLLVAPIAGTYVVSANVHWQETDSTGARSVGLKLNYVYDGSPVSRYLGEQRGQASSGGTQTMQSVASVVPMLAGDSVEVYVTNTGSSGARLISGDSRTNFSMAWISPSTRG